MKAAAPM